MNEMNFDWDDIRLFLAVARGGGLAPAAAKTGKSAPTLGRRMLALERRLGCDLFRRLPRGYELTEDGERLLTKAVELEWKVDPIIAFNATAAKPVVKISAGIWVTHLLCGKMAELTADSSVRLRFIAEDDVADIGRREALIGVRNRRPEGQGLAGRRVARIRFATYARDETITTWAHVVGSTPSAKWVGDASRNAEVIEVTSPRNALDLARAGSARVVLPTFVGDRCETLRQVSSHIDALEHDQWLVTHHEDRFLPEVRALIDRIYLILRSLSSST